MAPASAANATPNDPAPHHLPVFTISGCDVATGAVSGTKGSANAKATGPKSPAALSNFSFDGPVCRICHDIKAASGSKKLISPCGCTGSAEFVHKQCLQKWTKFKGSSICEVCHQSYQTKYVKYKLTTSEENTVASAITILLLLLGVLAVGAYLLAEYLIKVNRDPKNRGSNEIWVSISLVIIGLLGIFIFLPWFFRFCTKAGRTPRSSMMSPGSSSSNTESSSSLATSSSSADSPSSLESSLTDLSSTSSTADVESGQVAYNNDRAHQFAYDNELAYENDELPCEMSNEISDKEQSFAASGYHSISEANSNSAASSMPISVSTSVQCSSLSAETNIKNTFVDLDVQVNSPVDNTSSTYTLDAPALLFV